MEKQTVTVESTKADEKGLYLQGADAEEFRAYKRKKRETEIAERLTLSEGTLMGTEDVQRVCERARRLKQKAVQLPLTKLSQAKYYLLGSGVLLDCVVGGTGETLPKVKAYEAKRAVKGGAREITVKIAPSLVDGCRFGEIRKELKRIRRTVGKIPVKAAVADGCAPAALSRTARVVSEAGAKYFCVPYFAGCERLRLDVTGGCKLQIEGVSDEAAYQRLRDTGVGRIVTDSAWELYRTWTKETDEEKPKEKSATKKPLVPVSVEKKEGLDRSQTDYRCRLEGTSLKFF